LLEQAGGQAHPFVADYDLAIIGGGLLGVSVARDAAGRGLRVYLAEQNDLASGASHALLRLMDGGLDFLAHGKIGAACSALAERDIWLRIAPHLVRPLGIVRPLAPKGTALGVTRLQLFLYDRFARRSQLPRAETLDLTHHPMGVPLKRPYGTALSYSGCVADVSRLVMLTAVDAAARGADIRTGARYARAERGEDWRLVVIERGERRSLTARALVNASGSWINESVETILRQSAPPMPLVKYASIIVPRLYDHDGAYHLDDDTGRSIFTVPFGAGFTQIGCVSEVFAGDLATPALSGADIASLCAIASRYFRQQVGSSDVVHTLAAVSASERPVVRLDKRFREAPVVTVSGGGFVLARRTAEAVVSKLSRFFVMGKPWTSGVRLPGGDFLSSDFDDRVADARFRWPFLARTEAERLVAAYGTRLELLLGEARTPDDLGERYGEMTAAEIAFLIRQEWARTADDVIWRRSVEGLTMSAADRARLDRVMAEA
jgi:glycerol-3-phosphate dehydrogenase